MPSIEDSINQAMQDGKFDNLNGKGKPLRLEDHPYEDPEWRLAHHVLKENGFTLPWIELRQEIQAEITAARAALRQAWERSKASQDRSYSDMEWQRAEGEFKTQVERINERVRDYNIQTPSLNLQMPALNAEREIDHLKAI